MELLRPEKTAADISAATASLRKKLTGVNSEVTEAAVEMLAAKLSNVYAPETSLAAYPVVHDMVLREAATVSKFMQVNISNKMDGLRRALISARVAKKLIAPALSLLEAKLIKNRPLLELRMRVWETLNTHPQFGLADDMVYYAIREGVVYAIEFPYDYMDIYPYVTADTTRTFISKFISRDKLADQLRDNRYKLYARVYPRGIKERVNSATRSILSRRNGRANSPRVTFHFDCRRIITRVDMPPGHIHLFNILYELGWNDALVPRADSMRTADDSANARLTYINYKLGRDIAFDVIHGVIEATGSIDVWISEDHMASVSYMFVRLGSILCERDVSIVFENNYECDGDTAPWDAATRAGKYVIGFKGAVGVSVQDIHSVLAIYLLHHEIYHAGALPGTTVPSYLPLEKFTAPATQQYARLFELFRRFHKRWNLPMTGEAPEEEIDRVMQSTLADWARVPRGDDFIVVAAVPGTGKSTYTRSKEDTHAVLNIDNVMQSIRINGRLQEETVAAEFAGIRAACADLMPERLRDVVATTLCYERRRNITMPYRLAARVVECRLLDILPRPNILYETPELDRFADYTTERASTDCENFPRAPIPELLDMATEIVIFYNTLDRIYVQQLSRSLVEKRITRYYREADYYYFLTTTIFPDEFK
jgi:hypothetical protein